MGEFEIMPASDDKARPGDSAGVGNAVGPWKCAAGSTKAAWIKSRFAVFTRGRDNFHAYIVGPGRNANRHIG